MARPLVATLHSSRAPTAETKISLALAWGLQIDVDPLRHSVQFLALARTTLTQNTL